MRTFRTRFKHRMRYVEVNKSIMLTYKNVYISETNFRSMLTKILYSVWYILAIIQIMNGFFQNPI